MTYNHVNFIEDALIGFSIQKTSFPVVYLIVDDASTDGTGKKILEFIADVENGFDYTIGKAKQWDDNHAIYYCTKKIDNPNCTFLIVILKKNLYKQALKEQIIAKWESGIKYIARCEGDDFWTDSLKLQKQIDFLESHPDYTICCHRYRIVNVSDNQCRLREVKGFEKTGAEKGFTFSKTDDLDNYYAKTATICFRNGILNQVDFSKYKLRRDVHDSYHLLKEGLGFYLPDIMAVYREHANGIWGGLISSQKAKTTLLVFNDLLQNNQEDSDVRTLYLKKGHFFFSECILSPLKKGGFQKAILKDISFANQYYYKYLTVSRRIRALLSTTKAAMLGIMHAFFLQGRCIIYRIYHELLVRFFPKRIINSQWEKKFGYPIDWKQPRDINEKILWLLINGDTSKWANLADKVQVREYVAKCGLSELLIPLYGVWEDVNEINFDILPDSFVLKCNHDCGSTMIVNKKTLSLEALHSFFDWRLQRDYGYNGEFHYSKIPHRILAEARIGDGESSPIDYKVWCFHGKPHHILVCHERQNHTVKLSAYDLNWTYHPEYTVSDGDCLKGDGKIPQPASFVEMINAAKKLSQGFPEVRIDFYDIDGKLFFGEMTFTSYAGMMTYYTPDFLKQMGALVRLDKPA